jgi:hypothetical protein
MTHPLLNGRSGGEIGCATNSNVAAGLSLQFFCHGRGTNIASISRPVQSHEPEGSFSLPIRGGICVVTLTYDLAPAAHK